MAASVKGIGEQSLALRLLLACGVIAPVLFIGVFLIEGAARPDYSPLRHPVSALSIGDRGWIQVANFVITGLLLLAFAVGLRRVLRPDKDLARGIVLIGAAGIGLVGAGIFVMDPMNGYPPGTPLVPAVRSVQGRIHDLFGLPVFLGLPIACFIFRRWFASLGERGWALYSAFSGLAMFAAFVLAGMGFRQIAGFADFAGVFQRLSLITGFTWITLLALWCMSNTNSVRGLHVK